MTDDLELSRSLTAAVRGVDGVVGVYPAQPIVEAALNTIAVKLALRQPDILVDIDRAEGFTTVSVHVGTASSVSARDTVRIVGDLLRERLAADESISDTVAINVKVSVIEDADARPADETADLFDVE